MNLRFALLAVPLAISLASLQSHAAPVKPTTEKVQALNDVESKVDVRAIGFTLKTLNTKANGSTSASLIGNMVAEDSNPYDLILTVSHNGETQAFNLGRVISANSIVLSAPSELKVIYKTSEVNPANPNGNFVTKTHFKTIKFGVDKNDSLLPAIGVINK